MCQKMQRTKRTNPKSVQSFYKYNLLVSKFSGNSKFFNHLHQIKTQKLDQLIGPQFTNDSSPESVQTLATIPENLPLSESEKSVLSKYLNFVPIPEKTDIFSVKQDVVKFLRRVQLKDFFTKKGMILTPRTTLLSKHSRFESLNGLPQWDNSHL